MTTRHKVFISYHHDNDEAYKKQFESCFAEQAEVIVTGAVKDGDIDPALKTETIRQKIRDEYLRDTSVTVVLIGAQTWQRKHVDWEISSSIRQTKKNPRSGLLGILLPSYPAAPGKYNQWTIPPRLHDNIVCKYATIHCWTKDPEQLKRWVHEAYLRKSKIIPDNARDMFAKNRSGRQWQ